VGLAAGVTAAVVEPSTHLVFPRHPLFGSVLGGVAERTLGGEGGLSGDLLACKGHLQNASGLFMEIGVARAHTFSARGDLRLFLKRIQPFTEGALAVQTDRLRLKSEVPVITASRKRLFHAPGTEIAGFGASVVAVEQSEVVFG
jgi:hypothetical protein